MNREGLLALYAYNAYANNLLMDTVEQVAEAALTREASPSHGSVLKLLRHMLAVQTHFLSRSRQQPVAFDPSVLMTPAAIRALAARLSEETQAFIGSLDDAQLQRQVEVQIGQTSYRLPVWQALTQAVLHSIHHRGELSVVLTHLGHPLPTMDIIVKFVKDSGQPWPPA